MASQIISPPLLATQQVVAPAALTIVDNSVSNALANALQLLLVSDLIESISGPALAYGNIINNVPFLETITTPYGLALEIISPIEELRPCGPSIEFIQPCGAPIIETLQPNLFGGYTETFAPLYSPSVSIIEQLQPNLCGAITETLSYRNSPIIENIQPNIFGGITETFSPLYSNSIVEKIQPAFGGITETISTLYPPQIIEQFVPNSYRFTETIGYPFCGIKEMNPMVTPSYYERISEIVPPTAQFLPNYYGGITEIVTPPMAAEFRIPSSRPAQLTCNFGYNLPSATPAVNVNVEHCR